MRVVTDEDYCFLIERQTIWSEIIKDALNQAEIPFECTRDMGAAMAIKAGPYLENYQFYVPYAYYQQAKKIIDERLN